MNAIRQVQAFQGLDGQLHTSERAALLASISHVTGITVVELEEIVVPHLATLLPLLSKLTDPRHVTRPAPAVMQTEGLPPEEADLSSVAIQDVDIGDLRVGQIIETLDGTKCPMDVRIDELTEEEGQPMVRGTFMFGEKEATSLERITIAAEDVIRVVAQPEERMTLSEAKATLEMIEAKPSLGLADEQPVLDHKRRILLHRRIEQLEMGTDNAE